MKSMKRKIIVLILLITVILLAVLIACQMKHGLEPTPVIKGTIYLKGKRPDIAGEMITVVAPDFPPKKWTDIIRTTPLPIRPDYETVRHDTIEWEIALPTGSYDVIGILWKENDEEWSFETVSNILGVYNLPNQFKPAEVVLDPGVMMVDSVDMKADFGMIRYGSFIKGQISLKDEFRDDTVMMILAAFPMKPEKVIDYLYAQGWDLTVPINKSAYPLHYTLDVASSYIKYVAVFWKGEDSGPYDFKKIGEYMLQDEPSIITGTWKPEGIYVSEGDTLEDKFYSGKLFPDSTRKTIDIELDFSRTY